MRSSRRLGLFVFILVCSYTSLAQQLPYAHDRVIVRFKPGSKSEMRRMAHARVETRTRKAFGRLEGLEVVQLPPELSVHKALAAYRKDPSVLYAEPDYIIRATITPNDPSYPQLWGMTSINAPAAWNITTGDPNVVVAVIDSGVQYDHSDLAANMWRNPGDCTFNNIDDDGNGYVDDCHGIDPYQQDSDPMDVYSHGTHVAGTIGAVGNNGIGVAGVNWNVKILSCRFLGPEGVGFTSDAIVCLDYIADLKDRGIPIVASNNSWGSMIGGKNVIAASASLRDAIRLNMEKEILFIASAGNGGFDQIGDDNDFAPVSPSDEALPNMITVAAIQQNNTLTGFSNFGRHSVHLAAPGSGVLSTVLPSINASGYANFSGTSMAAPHVTGVVALLKAWNPGLEWWQIRNLILASGTDTAALAETTVTGKRLNAAAAFQCSDSVLLEQTLPLEAETSLALGSTLVISALHINCAAPNGNVTLQVAGGGTVVLTDDGSIPEDEWPGDGIYVGHYTPAAVGTSTLTFPDGRELTVNTLRSYSYEKVTEPYRNISGTSLNLESFSFVDLPSPFPLHFGGLTYDSVTVTPHGNLSFYRLPGDFYNAWPKPMPWAGDVIAPFESSLAVQTNSPQNVYYEVLGSAPNRELVIEWREVPMLPLGHGPFIIPEENVTFQVVFTENSDDILFLYKDVVFGGASAIYDNGWEAAVGIQIGKDVGAQYSFHEHKVFDGDALRWTLHEGPTISYLDLPFRNLDWNFAVTIKGTGFTADSVVKFAGEDMTRTVVPTYISPSELEVLASAGTPNVGEYSLTVADPTPSGDLVSNPRSFAVFPLPATVTSFDPTSLPAGAGVTTLRMRGSNFTDEMRLYWNFGRRFTRVISPTEAEISIQPWDLENPGSQVLAVDHNAYFLGLFSYEVIGYGLQTSGGSSQTVNAGQTAEYNLTLTPTGDFDQTVHMSCEGLPAGASCSFLPSSFTPGDNATPITLRISTASASVSGAPAGNLPLYAWFAFGALGVCIISAQPRSRAAMLLLCALSVMAMVSCGGGGGGGGGGSQSGNPSQTTHHTVQVVATSGSYSVSTHVTLNVN